MVWDEHFKPCYQLITVKRETIIMHVGLNYLFYNLWNVMEVGGRIH